MKERTRNVINTHDDIHVIKTSFDSTIIMTTNMTDSFFTTQCAQSAQITQSASSVDQTSDLPKDKSAGQPPLAHDSTPTATNLTFMDMVDEWGDRLDADSLVCAIM
jgi:hypothetical protein